jgi:2-haloalkanoic acid dehalogenase type II
MGSMPNPTAVIFDYYETLAELARPSRERVFDALARSVGAELAPGEAFRHWRERTTRDAMLRLGGHDRPPLDGAPLPFVSFRDVWLHRSGELFHAWGVDAPAEAGLQAYLDAHTNAPAYADALAAIDVLRSRCQLAVLSDADTGFLHDSLRRNGLPFETVVSSEDVRAYKPHASMFREVCARLGVAPEAAVYVGDSPWADVAGARNAGLRAVWLNRHGVAWPDDIAPPDAQIASLVELAAVLEA